MYNSFSEVPFLAFLALHTKKKRCGQVGPAYISHKVKSCMHPSFRSVAPRVCLAKVPILAPIRTQEGGWLHRST